MTLTSYRLLLIILLLATYINNQASTPGSQLLFSITSQKTGRLGIINTDKKPLELTIQNNSGAVFFTRTIKAGNNFFQILDLAKMEEGTYTIKASDGNKMLEKSFIVSASEVKIVKDKKAERPKPAFVMADAKTLVISYYNALSETVNVFFMMDDEVIFEDRGIPDVAITKKYSLQKLPAGDYVVKVYAGSMVFSYPLNLQ